MANQTKIVFLGATSMSFGLNMLRDIFSSDELRGCTLTLVGRNPADARRKWPSSPKLLNDKTGAGLIIEQTTDRRAAFDGAEFRRQCHGDRPQPALEARFRGAAQIRHPPHARRERRPRRAVLHAAHLAAGVRFRARDAGALPARRCSSISPIRKTASSWRSENTARSARSACATAFSWAKATSRASWGCPTSRSRSGAPASITSQCLLQIRDRATGEDLYPLLRAKEKDYDSVVRCR